MTTILPQPRTSSRFPDRLLEPDRVERLRKKLYEKAKREPDYRFYTLYDKVCWTETLHRAYRQAKANAGAMATCL
jgi:hypothetical protein